MTRWGALFTELRLKFGLQLQQGQPFLRLWAVLGQSQRHEMKILMVWVVASALAEVAMLAAVVPFVKLISGVMTSGGMTGSIQSAGPIFLAGLLLASACRLSLLTVQARCTQHIGEYLAARAYDRVLHRPYIDHVNSNTGDVITILTGRLDGACQLVISSATVAISNIAMSAAILATLMIIAPLITICIVLVLGSFYAVFLWRTRKIIALEAAQHSQSVSLVARVLTESLGGIRDVMLSGTHADWQRRFAEAQRSMRSAQARLLSTMAMPRTVVEAVGFTVVIVCACLLLGTSDTPASSLGALAVMVLGLQRLLPVAQGLYAAWHNFRSGLPHLLELLPLLELPEHAAEETQILPLEARVSLRGVHYAYPASSKEVLKGVDLVIPKGSIVGIIGQSGCGKSTLLDIVMGLLVARRGGVWIDDLELGARHASRWRKSTAYVSQTVHLIDGTILENIRMSNAGLTKDDDRLDRAVRLAGLEDFIASLPMGIATQVGERGVRLSGGQRQRIGIARALFTDAEFLVLDEATSSLDEETERKVIAAIADSQAGRTILMATHRMSTLRYCDQIYRLRGGRVEGPIPLGSIVQQ